MFTLPPARLALEERRAEEDQREIEAIERERLLWFGAAMACVAVGFWMVGMGFQATRGSIGGIWIGAGTLLGNSGPLVVLLIVLHREES